MLAFEVLFNTCLIGGRNISKKKKSFFSCLFVCLFFLKRAFSFHSLCKISSQEISSVDPAFQNNFSGLESSCAFGLCSDLSDFSLSL